MEQNKKFNLNIEHENQNPNQPPYPYPYPYPYYPQEEKKNKWVLPTLFVIIFLLLTICIVGLIMCWNKPCNCGCNGSCKPTSNNHAYVPDLDKDAGDYVAPETTGPAQGVAIPGWDKLIIPTGKSTDITVDFYNPEANKDLYYLTFELRLPNDSEQGYEVLYKSGLIEPGLHIQSIDLSRALSAGEYDAIIHVQPYRMADKSMTNNADLKTKLVVK